VVVISSRPGSIRKVVNVDLPRKRDRNSLEFTKIRKEIYKEFFDDADIDNEVEYYI